MKVNKRKLIGLALLSTVTLGAQNSYDVALIGDTPYGVQLEPAYERMIADINAKNPYLVAHIGDTKSGSTRCDDSHYPKVLNWFNSFNMPVLYSVGDNEWTDCMRANNGGFDPLGRLDIIRRTLFATDMTLGKRPIAVTRQSSEPGYSLYRENAMVSIGPALFVTMHMPGSNNNLEYKSAQGAANPFYDGEKEYTARNAANLFWLKKAFFTARQNNLPGLMILTQANMFETFLDPSTGSTHSGFADFITALRDEVTNFNGQVVMVSGDSHYMRVDKPLTSSYPACAAPTGDCKPVDPAGTRILNFTRVEVPGSADVHWVRCHVRRNRQRPFEFEFMTVAGNE